jgi:tubulin monoglycylase TTLL3/8
LFGIDFMFDESFRPYLIEFNTNPCLETGCPVLDRVIGSLTENLFRLVVDPLFPSSKAQYEDFLRRNCFEIFYEESM